MLDRPVHGQFDIKRVTLNYSDYTLSAPTDYVTVIPFVARTYTGTTASNLHFELEGTLPTGIVLGTNLILPAAVDLTENSQAPLNVSFRSSTVGSGSFTLNLFSTETGSVPLAVVPISYTVTEPVPVTPGEPVLNFAPLNIQTGVAQGGSITESITLKNNGFASLDDVTLELLNATAPAPDWLMLGVPADQGNMAVGESRTVTLIAEPPAIPASGVAEVPDGTYDFKLRIKSSNYPVTDIYVSVGVLESGIGQALFKVADIYTGTRVDPADNTSPLIEGLNGASIRLQNESVLSVDTTLTTDANGEVTFVDQPSGYYKFRVSAANHQEVIGRLQIKPGLTTAETVFLDYNLITFEWSVNETTIQDKYEIVLNATYETNVPAAVVLMEPVSTTLPDMKTGDVFYGEIRLSNFGLVRADNLTFTLPQSDEYIKYEFMEGLPTSLDAKASVVIAYRAVALKAIDPALDIGTGGGCGTYSVGVGASYSYDCANGTTSTGSTGHNWTYTWGSCGGGAAATSYISSGGVSGSSAVGSGAAGMGTGIGSISTSSTSQAMPGGGSSCSPDCPDGNCPGAGRGKGGF